MFRKYSLVFDCQLRIANTDGNSVVITSIASMAQIGREARSRGSKTSAADLRGGFAEPGMEFNSTH